MDAITLSTARLVKAERLDPDVGWRLILLASTANLFFKAGVVAFLGNWKLLGRIALLFGIPMLTGIALILFW